MAAVNTHGLFNLNDFLPKKPDETALKVLTEMFEASVDGEAYDPDRWSNYFRPAGMQARTGDPVAKPAATPAAPVAETVTDTGWKDPAPAATPEPAPAPAPTAEAAPAEDNAGGAQDILAMIRARQG
jgi:predicted component of type VI protein secretion system